jgi:hypothetical protein
MGVKASIFRIQIEFQRIDEFARVFRPASFSRSANLQRFVIVARAAPFFMFFSARPPYSAI